MFKKIKEFSKTKFGMHVYSFAKTYVTVFIGTYLTVQGIAEKIDPEILAQLNLTDMSIIVICAKGALIAVIRNFYKLLTE